MAQTENNTPTNCKWVISFLLLFAFPILISTLWVNSPINPVLVNNFPDKIEFVGVLSKNKILQKSKKILVDVGIGAESIEIDEEGNLYTGYSDGRLVKVSPVSYSGAVGEGEVTILCKGPIEDARSIDEKYAHGRPLGIRLDKTRKLIYVADAYYGLYKFDLRSHKRTILVPSNATNPPLNFPNDLTLSMNGTLLYFTDASSLFPMHRMNLEVLEGKCRGRVFRYNIVSKSLILLTSNICGANGIQLIKYDSELLVSEINRFRVLYIDVISGEVLKSLIMPCCPDNIRPSGKFKQYYIACPVLRSPLEGLIMPFPSLRRIMASVFSPAFLMNFVDTNYGLVVEIDEEGNIVSSFHDPSGNYVEGISQMTYTKEHGIFLGSFYTNCIVKMSSSILEF